MSRDTLFQKAFTGPGSFEAYYSAQDWLQAHGFSCGSSQRGEPCGILFGEFTIAKWKNMTLAEQRACHGTLTGDHRHGPVTVTIFADAPDDAIVALLGLTSKSSGKDQP